MCIAIYKPKKVRISRQVLRDCWCDNSDGAGFMYAKNGAVVIEKGFVNFKTFYKRLRKAESANNENFVIHFRYATHGKVDQANCHPFRVSDNIGFVHNGILHCVTVPKDSVKSDTAIFCETVLQRFPSDFLKVQGLRALLESIAKTEFSKFVFLDSRGTAHIFNESAGQWHEGCWFSNMSWQTNKCIWENIGFKHNYTKDISADLCECVYCGDYFEPKLHTKTDEPACEMCQNELEGDSIEYGAYYNQL